MVRTALVIALAVAATEASAQTTTCGEEFGKWVCRTQQPPPATNFTDHYKPDPDAFERGYERARRMQEDRQRAQQAQQQLELLQQQAAANPPAQKGILGDLLKEGAVIMREQEVAALLRAGKCQEAKMRALDDADIDLADKAARICAAQ